MPSYDRIAALLAPISADAPCGVDLSFSAEFDRIQEARREDDPEADYGEWQTELKQADWPQVVASTTHLLQTQSKDLRLVAWLAEALVKTESFAGLGLGLDICAALLDTFGNQLHPRTREDAVPGTDALSATGDGVRDDQEQRIASLSWMQTRLAQLAGEIAIEEDSQVQALAGWSADIGGAQAALHNLKTLSDRLFGAEGPAFHALQGRLAAADTQIKRLYAGKGLPVECRHSMEAATMATGAAGTARAAGEDQAVEAGISAGGHAGLPIAIASRTQALSLLRQAARFFRETEPHSPVSYLLDKAERWGSMPLDAWLRSVVKDADTLARLEDMLGLAPDAGASDD